MAPEISQTVAKKHAVRSDKTPEPTLVPNEFATSFAPMPNAKINAITKPTIMIHKTSVEYASNILLVLALGFNYYFLNDVVKNLRTENYAKYKALNAYTNGKFRNNKNR